MAMNLHLLRVFAAVAERRSFSRAAEALCISQPAVSKAVRALEHQLDLPLIERAGKGVRLTDSGQALFEHARGIFALERAALEEVRARVGSQRGRLLVGASSTVAGYWLPPYIAALGRRFPAMQLQVRVGNTQAISRALIDCDIDMAVVEGAVSDERIEATHWRDDELRIITHPGNALAKRRRPGAVELGGQCWLLREPGSGTREVAEGLLAGQGIEPQRRLEFGSNEGIARAVAAGLGVALLPVRVAQELIAAGAVKALRYPQEAPLLRPLYLLQLKERPQSPLARAFHELLVRRLKEE